MTSIKNMKKTNDYKILEDYAIMYVNYKDKKLEVMVDLEDIENVIEQGAWHAIYDKTLRVPSYYICHRLVKGTYEEGNGCLKLHRFVTECPRDKVVDHINHDTLDNRKVNLRVCTHFKNQQNLRSRVTAHTGVYPRHYRCGRTVWVANISKSSKRISKEFKNEKDAIEWRLQKMKELYGEVIN